MKACEYKDTRCMYRWLRGGSMRETAWVSELAINGNPVLDPSPIIMSSYLTSRPTPKALHMV